jgi:hypothetical protein
MRIYSRIVVDIATGKTIESESFEYEGIVDELKGPSTSYGKPAYSVASQIVGGKQIRDPLTGALRSDIITNPFTDAASREYKQAVADIRGGYGARGLEGSGIAIGGEQKAMGDIAAKTQAQRAGQLIAMLGTASNPPSFPQGTPQQGGGFMGLK